MNDHKNDYLRKKTVMQLAEFEMMRDALSIPNTVSRKTPKSASHIIKSVDFARAGKGADAASVLEALDNGATRANAILTTGMATRHLRAGFEIIDTHNSH